MARQYVKPRRSHRASKTIGAAALQLLEPRLLFAGNTFTVTSFNLSGIQAAMNSAQTGDTVFFPAGTYNLNGSGFGGSSGGNGLKLKSGVTYLGVAPSDLSNYTNFQSRISGQDTKGPQFHIAGDNVTLEDLYFLGGGVMIDKTSGYDTNILIDNCIFDLSMSGAQNNNGITATSGLQNSTISNCYFTGYNGVSFGIYGYNRNGLTVNNNEFVNVTAGIHIQSFSASDSNSLFEQNYITGVKGMGIELQGYGLNTTVQDNWYADPNMSSNPSLNSNSMAYSIIMDKSTNTLVQRNYVYDPERPDGIGTRIGIEIGGDNAHVTDNYINWVNAPIADNDGDNTASTVYVFNNYINNNREQVQINHPSTNPLRTMVASNNGSNVVTTWNPAVRGRPYRNVRYSGTSPPASPPPNVPPPPPPPPPPSAPLAPSNMSGTLVGMNQINFTWQDNSTNETDFVVQMLADDGITWVSIADVAANTTSYSLTNVASGKSYSFRVLAHNDAGYSDPSLSTNVTTPLTDVFSVATVSTTKKTRSSVSGSTASAPTQTAVS